MRARDRQGIVPVGPAFMSPESVKAIGHAIREAGRVGMELGFTTSSSWNAGGSWVKPEYASMGLFQSTVSVQGPAPYSGTLPFPSLPAKAPKRPDGLPTFYKDVAVLAVPECPAAPGGELVIEDPASIQDVSGNLQPDGRFTWDAPAGKWKLMRFVCANTGQGLAIPSPKSAGLAIDHFSAEATRMHFEYLIDKLQQEVGPLKNTALSTMYLCSYELRGAVWTPKFLEEFQRRRGYDMKPYLPVLFGAKIGGQDLSERFDHDYRKTQGDLLVNAFYRTAAEVCHQYGLLLCAEAGGPGPPLHNVPVDALKAQGAIDVPRGEFWTDNHLWVVKETACASHIYGKRIVDMEAFTSWDHWQYGPSELKPYADRALCDGANHFTFHTSPHRPGDSGLPGWAYHAGTHIAPSIVWWPKAKPFIDYLSRCCCLLQEGLFVGDVCYYYGDQGYNFVPPKHVDPSLGPGYDYDVANAEVLLERMDVRDERLVLPDGLAYELLVLPDREDVDLEVLRKLESLIRRGATVVGRKPTRGNGLADCERRDAEIRQLADQIWGPCDGKNVLEQVYGDGKVVWGRRLRDILKSRGVGPDFAVAARDGQADLDFIHRRVDDADVYFVANRKDRWESPRCVFRVRGKAPEIWTPDNGEHREAAVFQFVEGGTEVPLRLPPFGAVFVVFRRGVKGDHLVGAREVEGDSSKTALADGALELIRNPESPSAITAIAFRPGRYALQTARGKALEAAVPQLPAPSEIGGPWTVRFPDGWGAPASVVFERLASWPERPEEGVQYFSGIAVYEKDFEAPPQMLAPGLRLYLDLGRVQKLADVSLNGQRLGIVWKEPYRLEVTQAIRPGRNRLVVEVANTWSNRLVGDARSPEGKQYCRTNITGSGKPIPWRDVPLLEAGLLGPVKLVPAGDVHVPLAGPDS